MQPAADRFPTPPGRRCAAKIDDEKSAFLGGVKIKTRYHIIAAFILLVQGLEQLNATVRRTVACRRLDGDNTSIFATGENANESRQ